MGATATGDRGALDLQKSALELFLNSRSTYERYACRAPRTSCQSIACNEHHIVSLR